MRDTSNQRRTAGDLAHRMTALADALRHEVRDHDAEWLAHRLAPLSVHALHALVIVLAAMVPDKPSAAELLAWVTWDEYGRPLTYTPHPPEPLPDVPIHRPERLHVVAPRAGESDVERHRRELAEAIRRPA
jgi:hypothetical protein